jgi:hypothetical protein
MLTRHSLCHRAQELIEAVDDVIRIVRQAFTGLMALPAIEHQCAKLCASYAVKFQEVIHVLS